MDYDRIIPATDSPALKKPTMKHFKCLCWGVNDLLAAFILNNEPTFRIKMFLRIQTHKVAWKSWATQRAGVFCCSMNADNKGQEKLN